MFARFDVRDGFSARINREDRGIPVVHLINRKCSLAFLVEENVYFLSPSVNLQEPKARVFRDRNVK